MSLGTFLRNWLVGSTAIVGVAVAVQSVSDAVVVPPDQTPVPGMQGTDTSLRLTDSALSVSGRGAFADLKITVNQTEHLTNQAIGITWEGGAPTVRSNGSFQGNFLQFMQCWGDPVVSPDGTEGPPPEQCEFGAFSGLYAGVPATAFPSPQAFGRRLGLASWPVNEVPQGVVDPSTTIVWRPFRSVDGTVVDVHTDLNYRPGSGANYWLNPYFDALTTNELPAARTYPDGTGQVLFETVTGVQSSGLGCGKRAQRVDESNVKIPRCWLVVVPRGEAADENVGTPFASDPAGFGVNTSPLADAAWSNRIAVELHFNPVDSPCSIDAEDRRLVGTDLAVPAVASWQPVLCTTGDLPPYSYATVGDPLARQQIVTPAAGGPGLAVVSAPVAPELVPTDRPLVYAPVAVSGVVIGVNVERYPRLGTEEETPLAGTRVAELNLTPRLVAKLLTQSYRQQLAIYDLADYAWVRTNPVTLVDDPDFLRYNPEFNLLWPGDSRTFSGLQVPQGNSDAARLVWEWILADPEASAWLAGTPDEHGMVVNPYYSTNAALNPTGVPFGSPTPVNFPKSDPYCYQSGPRLNSVVPIPLCGIDWMPYARNMADTARITRTASDGARVDADDFPLSPSLAWKRVNPQFQGFRSMWSITDSPSAARLGVQVVRLSRAGDDGTNREFIAPDAAGLAAGLSSMRARSVPTVLEPDVASQPSGAYPLTILSYAVTAPLSLDTNARHDYAEFLRYAAGDGQREGLELGNLPPGYLPLTAELRAATLAAADTVETLQPTPTTTTTSTTTTAPTTTTTTVATEPPAATVPTAPESELVASGRTSGGGGGGRGGSGGSSRQSSPVSSETTPPVSTMPPVAASSVPPTSVESPPSDTTPPVSSVPPVGEEPPGDVEAPALLTPIMAMGQSRLAVPALGIVGLGSALGALEITKRPRRRTSSQLDQQLEGQPE